MSGALAIDLALQGGGSHGAFTWGVLDARQSFLARQFGLGREAAQRWLSEHRADVGVRATLDIAATFLAPR